MLAPKILLIYPPPQFMPQETARPDGGLGLLYLAGALEDAGMEVDVLDAALGDESHDLKTSFYRRVEQENGLIRLGLSFEEIASMVARKGYNVVGIHSNFTPQTRMALETARAVKKISKDILVIVGGVNARNLIEYFLRSGDVDFVATTESEKTLVRLVRQWSLGLDPGDIDGMAFLEEGTLVVRPPSGESVSTDLDDLPLPRWHKLPLTKYARVSGPHGDTSLVKGRIYAPIMTSRGCPFKCSYCHISVEKEDPQSSGGIGALRLKSVDRVIEEVIILKHLGVSRLYFEDDSLLARKERVKQIFGRVAGLGLSIADVNGVNLVHFLRRDKNTGKLEPDREYFEILKAAGFDHIVFPVESGSQRILDKYATAKLKLEIMDVVALVKTAVEVGIACPVNMMIGFPDETEAEINQSIELAKKLIGAGAERCAFFIPIPFPGSQLFNLARAEGYLDLCFDPDKFNIHRVCMKNTMVSPERLLELKEEAWRTVNPVNQIQERLRLSVGAEVAVGR